VLPATSGSSLYQADLSTEAIRLTRMVTNCCPMTASMPGCWR